MSFWWELVLFTNASCVGEPLDLSTNFSTYFLPHPPTLLSSFQVSLTRRALPLRRQPTLNHLFTLFPYSSPPKSFCEQCTPSPNAPLPRHSAAPPTRSRFSPVAPTRRLSSLMTAVKLCFAVSTSSLRLSVSPSGQKVTLQFLFILSWYIVLTWPLSTGRNVIIEQPYGGPKITKGESRRVTVPFFILPSACVGQYPNSTCFSDYM